MALARWLAAMRGRRSLFLCVVSVAFCPLQAAGARARALINEENIFQHNSTPCQVDIVGAGNASFCDGPMVRTAVSGCRLCCIYFQMRVVLRSSSPDACLDRFVLCHLPQLRAVNIEDYKIDDPIVAISSTVPWGMHVTPGANNSYIFSWCGFLHVQWYACSERLRVRFMPSF